MRVVVAVALLRELDGRREVLAAQRAHPPELAGCWELPGGKVEPGESEAAAVVRECAEELAVAVAATERLGPAVVVADGRLVLHLWTGRILAGRPACLEHRALRWLAASALRDVEWLDADEPFLVVLAGLLGASG